MAYNWTWAVHVPLIPSLLSSLILLKPFWGWWGGGRAGGDPPPWRSRKACWEVESIVLVTVRMLGACRDIWIVNPRTKTPPLLLELLYVPYIHLIKPSAFWSLRVHLRTVLCFYVCACVCVYVCVCVSVCKRDLWLSVSKHEPLVTWAWRHQDQKWNRLLDTSYTFYDILDQS